MSKKSISKRKKIIVTGGAGFIGSHLVERLVELKYNVIVIDDLSNGSLQNIKKVKQNIKFLKTDLNSKKIFKYFKNVEAVFHLAALADIVPSIENPKKYFYANVSATENILNISIKNNVKKFIYAASSSCYGIPNKYPTNENTILDPQYPYALSKKMGEDLVMHYGKIYKLNVCSLRLFNVYGPRSRTSGTYGAVFGVFLKQKLMNMPFTIVGNGKQKRDFTFVYDVVNAFLKAFISKKSNKNYNIKLRFL
jgi:UDP-glucose 4-epimerase